jgi:hypothetical protein
MDQQEFERCLVDLSGTPAWIAAQAKSVPEDGWETVIHNGEGGWNRRQMLAHIVTIDKRHAMRVRIGAGIPDASGVKDQSKLPPINDWNQKQVDVRAGASIEELLTEMRTNREDLIALLKSLTREQRERVHIDRANLPATPFSEWMPHIHEHAVAHMQEVTG